MISIVILTLNEAADLPACLASLTWCDDIHVVDSGSTDATVQVATERGAHVYANPFESFGRQRNWALVNCVLKYPWILFLDADECSTPEFHQAVVHATGTAPDSTAGFYCCWKLILQDRWLKHCDSFPKWQFRLLRSGRAAFTDFGHGQKEDQVNGAIEYIREPYLHFAFSKGWSHWLRRHDRYSGLEAAQRNACPIRWREIFSAHGSVRNKALKPLVSRVPGWPLLMFAIRYFAKLGFTEGRPGFVYCVNMAYYEFLIIIKMEELKRGETAGRPPIPGNPSSAPPGASISQVAGDRAPSSEQDSTLLAGPIVKVFIFVASLTLVLYFALIPARPSRLRELPRPIGRWLNAHDDLSNFAVFAILGLLAFALPHAIERESDGSKFRTRLSEPYVRLVLLLALVVGLECAQVAIPGRISDWRDVVTGSAGVVGAWLVYRCRCRPVRRALRL